MPYNYFKYSFTLYQVFNYSPCKSGEGLHILKSKVEYNFTFPKISNPTLKSIRYYSRRFPRGMSKHWD